MLVSVQLVFQFRSDITSNVLFISIKNVILHRKECRLLPFPRCLGKEQTIETQIVGMNHLYWNTDFLGLLWYIYLVWEISKLPHLGFQYGLFPGWKSPGFTQSHLKLPASASPWGTRSGHQTKVQGEI